MINFPDKIAPLTIKTSPETARGYAELTKDWNPIHLDPKFAAGTDFGRPIAHGTMGLNLLIEAIRQASDNMLYIADVDIRFVAPTFVGQSLTATATRTNGATYDVAVTTDDGRLAIKGVATLAARAAAK